MAQAELREVIWMRFSRGDGTEEYPHRMVTQWRTKDGELIREYDPVREEEDDSEA